MFGDKEVNVDDMGLGEGKGGLEKGKGLGMGLVRKLIFQSEASLGRQSQLKNGTKTNQYLVRPEGILED